MCGQGAAAQPNRSNGLAGRQADRAAGCETPTLFIEFLAYSERLPVPAMIAGRTEIRQSP